jgi:hypothetical protein
MTMAVLSDGVQPGVSQAFAASSLFSCTSGGCRLKGRPNRKDGPNMVHDHHEHGHSQALGHTHAPANFGKAFATGVALNGAFAACEVISVLPAIRSRFWQTGTGSEIMQRIAGPMIGGMASSTLLTLIVIPAVYGRVKGWRLTAMSRIDRASDENDARSRSCRVRREGGR